MIASPNIYKILSILNPNKETILYPEANGKTSPSNLHFKYDINLCYLVNLEKVHRKTETWTETLLKMLFSLLGR